LLSEGFSSGVSSKNFVGEYNLRLIATEAIMKFKQFKRQIEKMIAEDGDHCTLCGLAFPHGGVTFFGVLEGKVQIVGKCCSGKLKRCLGGSIYVRPEMVSGGLDRRYN
jgi:hypothetical protein